MVLQNNLKYLRERMGHVRPTSQVAIAEELGMSQAELSKLENKEPESLNIGLRLLIRMARHYGYHGRMDKFIQDIYGVERWCDISM